MSDMPDLPPEAAHRVLDHAEMDNLLFGEQPAPRMWSPKEKRLVDELMKLRQLNERALVRQAVRLYQLVVMAEEAGLKMGFYDAEGRRVQFPDLPSKLPPNIG